MSFKIIIAKLEMDEKKFVDSSLLKEYCKTLKIDYLTTIKYLLNNRYLYRILRGVFYKPSIEERKLKRIDVNLLKAISEALKMKGVKNWYFGLDTALKLNNLTHEFFAMDFVVSDRIFRAKPITILGNKVRFVKLKRDLIGFGIIKKDIPYSDTEKTVLDMVYLLRYEGLNDSEINLKIGDLLKVSSVDKMRKYSKEYNGKISEFIRGYYEKSA